MAIRTLTALSPAPLCELPIALLFALLFALSIALCGCASGPEFGPSPGPALALAGEAAPGCAAAPYTPEQIRWSHPVGTFTSYAIQMPGAADAVQETEWIEVTPEACRMRATTLLADLTPVGGPEEMGARWSELRDHANFPAAATETSREVITTPAGQFECWKYVVQQAPGVVATYWFDMRSAGSPVAVETVQEGAVVQRMSLIAHNRRAL